MNDQQRAAMQMALDTLIDAQQYYGSYELGKETITALREALENNELSDVTLINEGDMAQPQDNLNCKSVQARLATLWGYVKAQPQGEPVAWMNTVNGFICKEKTRGYHTPLYSTPPSVEAARIADSESWIQVIDAEVAHAIEATKEKAAKVCEEVFETDSRLNWCEGVSKCAAAIRSMK